MDARRTLLSVAAILSLTAAVQALQMAPAGSIAGQWPLDTVNGTTTPNVVAGGSAATLVGGPTPVPGLAGNGLQFTGTGRYLTVPHSTAVDVAGGDFSVAAWVYPENNTAAMRVFNKWDGTRGFVFDINTNTGGGAAAQTIRARLNDGTNDANYSLATTITPNVWQHIAMTVNRTGDVLRFYRNGTLVVGNQSLTALTGSLSNTALVGIGTIPSATGNWFNGILDEPILYKRVLSDAEVLSLATMPPAAPGAPTATNGQNQVQLTWAAVAGANTYNVLRSQTSGGPASDPFVIIASGLTGLTYTDTTAANPYTYYYVVQAVAGATPSPNSPQAIGTPLPVPVTALPNTGLQTNENGATTLFTITYNTAVPPAGSRLTVISNDLTEGTVSTGFPGAVTTPAGFYIDFTQADGSPVVNVTVTGIDDVLVDPSTAYSVSITATNMAVTIPNVQLVNNDNDVAGITLSRTAGLSTSENLTSDTFTVSLNTQPSAPVTMTLTSSNTLEGTVSPGTITFNTTSGGANGWNVAQVVTLTGVEDAALDFSVGYMIVTGDLASADGNYNLMVVPDVAAVNADNEQIPALPGVWGDGGGGGCGLLGLELALALALARLRRRHPRQ